MNKQELLTNWVRAMHNGQLIKRTDEPYFNHLIFVAKKVNTLTKDGYEIGLCHDLLEKTTVTVKDMHDILVSFGFTDAAYIVSCVQELTSQGSKKQEAARLPKVSAGSQTVKYADLLYNIRWVMTYQKRKHKALKYLRKKRRLLTAMDKGDPALRAEVFAAIGQASGKLK